MVKDAFLILMMAVGSFILVVDILTGCDEGASVKFVTENAMIAVMTETNKNLLKEFTGIKRRLHKLESKLRDGN